MNCEAVGTAYLNSAVWLRLQILILVLVRMGSACCVAARDKTIPGGPSNEFFHRNIRHSPTWSFRWENRGRVAGEEASVGWFSDGISQNNHLDVKYESAYASEDGSSLDSSHRPPWPKSPFSEGTARLARTAGSDQSISHNVSLDVNLEQADSRESPAYLCPSPTKISHSSLPSASSPLPSSSQIHLLPASLTPSRQSSPSAKQPSQQRSDNKLQGSKSPSSQLDAEERPGIPSWSNDSTRGSYGGSSDGWSVNAFSELVATSRQGSWSFDGEPVGLKREKITKRSSQTSADQQTCGVCTKSLTEKSSWSAQKIIANNELSVVAVLMCGHIYHAECLEIMTPDIDKYDPTCPICTFGVKQTLKMSEKALKAEMDSKIKKGKRSRNQVVDSDVGGDYVYDRIKSSGSDVKSSRAGSSSVMRSSSGKPFLSRHFSFGSKGSRSLKENHSTRKKGFFWTKSSKE
ncbi:uncharacterized protein LOC115689588 [Syzygium oleosum]|uniref:uncharacterized protein LOC115689588 n=1 Tax=Syzygium oleosum TaxID=219896 RepID=UPI0011D18E86|nr:uncharacterized protein LOC115689588 [Syzygium oleosum]XP_056164344.1 uncharacterized protein LOC115689588 [Syzygium oleosum]